MAKGRKYIERWECTGALDECGTPCRVEISMQDSGMDHIDEQPRFDTNVCLTSRGAYSPRPDWKRLPDVMVQEKPKEECDGCFMGSLQPYKDPCCYCARNHFAPGLVDHWRNGSEIE